jgi:hypothetical protein
LISSQWPTLCLIPLFYHCFPAASTARRATKLYLSHLLHFFSYTTRGEVIVQALSLNATVIERPCSTFAYRGSSHRRKSAALHKFQMVWLYRSPYQWRGGMYCTSSNAFYLPSRLLEEGSCVPRARTSFVRDWIITPTSVFFSKIANH